jgi:ferric-dicitrate binding protein FerR (iron transport regulator)
VFKIAASIALVALFSWLLYHTFFSHETILKESQNSIVMVALPDGSEVWLNQHSRLTYQDDFNDKNRSVQLEGEAFFEVRKDTQRPFIIQTQQAKVQVLGTSFNVQAYEETNSTEVHVASGLVSISSIENKTGGIALKPGETGRLTNGNIAVFREEEDFNALAWKEKRLIFKKTPLNTVFKNLEEYFKIRIAIKNATILQCRFTGSFNQPTLEEIIEALSVSLDLTIAKENDTYVIDGDGC